MSSSTADVARFYIIDLNWRDWNYAFIDDRHNEDEWTVIEVLRNPAIHFRQTIKQRQLNDSAHYMGTVKKCADFDEKLAEAGRQAIFPTGADKAYAWSENWRFMMDFWKYLGKEEYITQKEYTASLEVIEKVQAENNAKRRAWMKEQKGKACAKCGKQAEARH